MSKTTCPSTLTGTRPKGEGILFVMCDNLSIFIVGENFEHKTINDIQRSHSRAGGSARLVRS